MFDAGHISQSDEKKTDLLAKTPCVLSCPQNHHVFSVDIEMIMLRKLESEMKCILWSSMLCVWVLFNHFFPYSQVQLLCSLLHSKATTTWWSFSLNLVPPLNLRIRYDALSVFICWYILPVRTVVSSSHETWGGSRNMAKWFPHFNVFWILWVLQHIMKTLTWH